MESKVTVIKIGSEVLDNEVLLQNFLKHFSKIDGPKVLVHGGGKSATQLGEQFGSQAKMVDGRRITDASQLKVVTMTYSGWINSSVVAQLQGLGCNALGLNGADANLILSAQRPELNGVDYGFVGDVKKVNHYFLDLLLDMGVVPVVCAITHDGEGQLLNTNADTVAAEVASSLTGSSWEVKLIYCFGYPGVMKDLNDRSSWIPVLENDEVEEYTNKGIIHSGMLPKLTAGFLASSRGVLTSIQGVEELVQGKSAKTQLAWN